MATASDIMKRIGEKIAGKNELKSSVGAVYKFALEGDGGATYLVDLKSDLKVTEGDGPAACTIRMTASDFVGAVPSSLTIADTPTKDVLIWATREAQADLGKKM